MGWEDWGNWGDEVVVDKYMGMDEESIAKAKKIESLEGSIKHWKLRIKKYSETLKDAEEVIIETKIKLNKVQSLLIEDEEALKSIK